MDGQLAPPPETGAIDPRSFVAFVTGSANLAAEISDVQLGTIAADVLGDHELDSRSMDGWRKDMERGVNLASLVKEDKTYPFRGAANVRYPLVTSAALQFNARAYPAIVPPDRVVNAKVWGSDRDGAKAARADRVSEHMSWQLTHKIEEWESETDRLLTMLPIVGCMIRKWWWDPVRKRPRCRLVDPGRFVINDKVKSLADAPRCGEEIPLYPNEIRTRIASGQFVPFEWTANEDDKGPQTFIEQHTRLDLDEDGRDEPYIVTVHKDTQTVVRIVADFTEADVEYETQVIAEPVMIAAPDPVTGAVVPQMTMQEREVATSILEVRRGTHFVAFTFLPSMDGGFHGTGLGLLLGDISETINTIINMMLDAGHYAALGGGFIGSDFRMKGGSNRMRPGEWVKVQATGAEVKNAIVPMTLPSPDATLFQLLGLLIDAGREIASVKDVMTGEAPRQNQTATATLALIEQGQMVFTAAYKRIFRALSEEYTLLARLNAQGDPAEYQAFHDMQADVASDYDLTGMDISPTADPRSVTKMQEAAKAQLVMELADKGLVDKAEATSRVVEAMSLGEVEALMPKPDPMQQMAAEMQMQVGQSALMQSRADVELTLAKIESERARAVKDMASAEAEQFGLRLDAIKVQLEDDRARLDAAIRRSSGGVAGEPRDAGAGGGRPQDAGPAGGGVPGPMVAGLAPAGGGAPGPDPGAGGF